MGLFEGKGSRDRKANAFDKISRLFYNRNFGTATKSEIELLMYSIFVNELLESGENVTPHQIAKRLGISDGREKTLRVKKGLTIDDPIDWKQKFWDLLVEAETVRDGNGWVMFSINDPLLRDDVKDALDAMHVLRDTSFEGSIIKVTPDCFCILCDTLLPEEEANKVQAAIKLYNEEVAPQKDGLDKIEQFTRISKNVADILVEIIAQFSPEKKTERLMKTILRSFK